MSWWKIMLGLVLLGGIAAVVVMNLGPKEKVKIQVQVEQARREPITQVVTASGKIRPETEVKVAADVGGYINKLTVKEGDKVEAGQLLVEIDPEIYRARVKEGRAAEQTARANLALSEASQLRAQGEEKRVRGLFAKDLTSRANLEKAQADKAIAEAEVEAARGRLMQSQAALDNARKNLAKCTISAPISGTVTVLNKEQGERASGGDFREDIIMNVSDLSSMEVEVEVGERDVVLIQEGDPVEIEVDAFPGETIPGHVKEVANAGVTRNQWTESEVTNFTIVIQVGETEKRLRPQMSATVKVRTDEKDDALTVPIQSVTLRRPAEIQDPKPEGAPPPGTGREGRGPEGKDAHIGKPGEGKPGEGKPGADKPGAGKPGRQQPVEIVFVVEDGRAVAKRVETGLSSDTRIEITSGIEAGTKVVSGPYRALSKDLHHLDEVQVGDGMSKGRRGRRGGKGRPGGGH